MDNVAWLVFSFSFSRPSHENKATISIRYRVFEWKSKKEFA
jgi:hypothetical protein